MAVDEIVRTKPGRPSTRDPLEAGNQSTMVGLRLLQAVAAMPEPASLTEIAQRTGMPVSRAYRYLTTLAQSGFLRHVASTGKYDLGLASLQLGLAAMGRIDAIQYASEVMASLTEETRLVSILAVWGSNGPTVIKWERGWLEMSVHTQVGLNLPLLSTAAGQVFLAFLEESRLTPILERELEGNSFSARRNRKVTAKDAEKIRKQVRSSGIASNAGLRTPNVGALAAPVFDGSGKLAMAVSLVGVMGAIDLSLSGPAAQKLREATQRLSAMLGAPGHDAGRKPAG